MNRYVERQSKEVQRYFSVDPGDSVGVGPSPSVRAVRKAR